MWLTCNFAQHMFLCVLVVLIIDRVYSEAMSMSSTPTKHAPALDTQPPCRLLYNGEIHVPNMLDCLPIFPPLISTVNVPVRVGCIVAGLYDLIWGPKCPPEVRRAAESAKYCALTAKACARAGAVRPMNANLQLGLIDGACVDCVGQSNCDHRSICIHNSLDIY